MRVLFWLSCVLVTTAAQQVVDRIVAVVNADVVTMSELERSTVDALLSCHN